MAVNIDDILASVSSPSLIKDSYINKGQFLHLSNGDFEIYTGGFTVVFPVIVNGEKWAFRCWHANLGNVRRRFEAIAHAIQKSKASYLCDFAYTDEGIIVDGKIYPTTRMRWVDGLPIKEYICRYKSDKKILEALAKKFLSLVQDMHRNYLAHGDLQHGNIIVDTSGELFLVDYDSFYCEDLKGEPDIITGLKDYQHPLRRTNKITSEKIDYFSELIIYLSIIGIAEDPTLVPRFQIADADRLLFESTDFANLKSSRIYNALKGKTPVIDILLSVLEQYLQCSSINQLEPFDILFTQSLENLRPKVKSFEVSKELVTDADIVTLSWSTKNATYVTLNGVRVAANGSKELPAKEKYVLRTKNDVDIIEKSIKIKVKYPLVISSFVVKDENVVAEKACSIQWEGRNVASILLDNEEYPVKSPISFVPAESGKHEVKFIGKDGSVIKKEFEVKVVYPDPQIKINVPPFAKLGQKVSIRWETAYVDYVVVDGVVLQKDDSYQWTYNKDARTKTLLLYGLDGKEHQKEVKIREAQPAIIHNCGLSETQIKAGGSCWLAWAGDHVVSWSVEGGGRFGPEVKIKKITPTLERFGVCFTGEDGETIRKEISLEIIRKPIIDNCRISPSTPAKGEPCKIEWASRFVDHVEIDGKTFAANDSYTIFPEKNKTVCLYFYGKTGDIVIRNVGITLPPISIESCMVSPKSVQIGNPCVISWQATNVDHVTIKGKDYYSSGTYTYNPTSSGRVELKFYGDDGSTVTRRLTVNVTYPPAEVESLQISPSKVKSGGQVTLSWKSKNVRSVSICSGTQVKNGLPACGDHSVPVCANCDFRVSFHGEDGNTVTKILAAQVIHNPKIYSCTIDKPSIQRGESCTIRWGAENVAYVMVKGKRYNAIDSFCYTPQESEDIRVIFYGEDGSEYYRTVSVEVKQSTNGCLKAFLVFILVIIVGLLFVLLVGNTTSTTPKPTPKSSGKTHPTTITTKQSQIDANVQALANAVNQADVDHIESLEVAVKKLNELKKLRPYNGEDETKIRNRAQKIKDEIESSPVSDLPENQRKIEQINNILNRL